MGLKGIKKNTKPKTELEGEVVGSGSVRAGGVADTTGSRNLNGNKWGNYTVDDVQAAPLVDVGNGQKKNVGSLPDGYEYYNYAGPAQTRETMFERGNPGKADNDWLDDDSYAKVQEYKRQFAEAQAAGDTAGMNAAHEAAEKLRYYYGYSGGADGSEYLPTMVYTGESGSGYGSGYGDNDFSYGNAPSWISRWQSQIDSLADAILNREAFSYNKDDDPLYQQYADSYTRAGNRAMQDTLGQVSARTGGLASSYATTASQQAYNNYMAELADKVPELYQLAYSMYQDDLSNKRNDLSMLMGLDDSDYNKYLTDLGQWNTDRDFNYNSYRDSVADSQWQQSFDYNASRDSVADQQWQLQFEYQQAQDALAQQNWASEFEYQKAQDALDREYQERQQALKSNPSGGDSGGFDMNYFYSLPEDQAYNYLISNDMSTTKADNYMNYWYDKNTADEGGGENDPEVLNRTKDGGDSIYISHIGWVDYQELRDKIASGEVREVENKDNGTIRFVAVYSK